MPEIQQSNQGNVMLLLSQKVDSMESHYEQHSSKVENRLDQLVDIMRQVAILQEREMKNADTIREIKDGIRRSHERIDSILGQIEDHSSDLKTQYTLYIEKETNKFDGKFKDLDVQVKTTDETLKSWLNRGKGAWYVMVISFAIVQAGAGYMFTQIVDRINHIDEELKESVRVHDTIHNRINTIQEAVDKVKPVGGN